MKRNLLALMLLTALLFWTNIGFSQCVPDPSCTDPEGDGEFCPTEFPDAIEDVYYEQVLTIISPIEQLGVDLHHIEILDIGNIPPGMNFQCQDDNCSFYPAVPKCVNVYGTPAIGSAGIYNLHISIEVFIDVAGFPFSFGIIEDSSAFVIIRPQLNADFMIDYGAWNMICIGNEYQLTYLGNASEEANYIWDFGDRIEVISGEGQGPLTIINNDYNYHGIDSISLVVEEGAYTSPIYTEVFETTVCEGIEEGEEFSLSVHPNPFTDIISINGLNGKNGEVNIYDLSGRLLKNQMLTSTDHQISLQEFKKGIYFLSISNSKKTQTIKLIKQ